MYKAIGFVILALIVVSFLLTLLFFPLIREIFPGTAFLIPFFSFLGVLSAIGFLWFLLVNFRATLAAVWFPIKSLLLFIFKKKKYPEMLESVVTGYLHDRLSKLYDTCSDQTVVKDPDKRKYILFSDCHRGDGSWADDFATNASIYQHALNYYNDNGYTYIELGDGDELWESKFKNIWKEYEKDIFELLDKFHEKGRLYLLWGNHDKDKFRAYLKDKKKKAKNPNKKISDKRKELLDWISDKKLHEGIVLKLKERGGKGLDLFLIHGHQVDYFNNFFIPIGKFITRKFWRALQNNVGLPDTTSPAKNFKKCDFVDNRLISWIANRKKLIVVAGHNHHHRLITYPPAPYFNTGSCVHPRFITGIEISNENNKWKAVLVKWQITISKTFEKNMKKKLDTKSAPCSNLMVCRSVDKGPIELINVIHA